MRGYGTYCKHLSKTFQNSFKCKLYKKYINLLYDCKNCPNFILTRNKGINKVSKKRICVKPEIYNEVFERDKGRCQLADIACSGKLELHHIIYRSENKKLINEPKNCIMLCNGHHRLVHSNKHLWQPILLKIIKKFYKKPWQCKSFII